jgi:hypothetical protein
MRCDSATAQYPTDGAGGKTTTAGSSSVINATLCVIERIYLVTHSASSTLLLRTHADGAIETFALPDATQVMMPIDLEFERPGPFAFKLGGGSGVWMIGFTVRK